MLYIEYAEVRKKQRRAQKDLEALITEKDKIFQMTQPKSTLAEHEREFDKHISVGGGSDINQIEEYIIRIEEKGLNERIEEAKKILDEWTVLLEAKETELKKSMDTDDMIYVKRFIYHKKPSRIALEMNYSTSQIYKRLKKIREQIKDATK